MFDKNEIIEMAKLAGIEPVIDPIEGVFFDCYQEELERFAKLIAFKEREACADLCATWYHPMWSEHNQAGNELATAIRARVEA